LIGIIEKPCATWSIRVLMDFFVEATSVELPRQPIGRLEPTPV